VATDLAVVAIDGFEIRTNNELERDRFADSNEPLRH
jgi:hypothetical protein